MEITPLMIYLINIADSVLTFLSIVTGLGGVVGFVYVFCSFENGYEIHRKWMKRFLIAYVTCVFLLIITPSSKTLVAMYVIPPIAKSQVMNEIPDVLMDFVKSYVGNLKNEGDV